MVVVEENSFVRRGWSFVENERREILKEELGFFRMVFFF